TVAIKDGKIAVKEASRVPLVKVLDAGASVAVWAYRRKDERGPAVVLVAAQDYGEGSRRGSWYGWPGAETTLALPTQSVSFASSATTAHQVAGERWEWEKKGKRPSWTGLNFKGEASTSKSSADPAPMVSLFLRR